MELQEFVSESLRQIVVGVKNAQIQCHEQGARVNPEGMNLRADQIHAGAYDYETNLPVQLIDFDVAVTVSENSEKAGKAGLSILSVGLGGHIGSTSASQSVSRIKFSVPVLLPSTPSPGESQKRQRTTSAF